MTVVFVNMALTMALTYYLYIYKPEIYQTMISIDLQSLKPIELRRNWLFNRYWKTTYLCDYLSARAFKCAYILFETVIISLVVFLLDAFVFKALAVLLCIVVPLFLLELRIQWVHREIDKAMMPFFSAVNSNLLQNSDLIKALSIVPKLVKCPYLVNGIERFNITIKAGLSQEKAFSILLTQTSHVYLKYVFLNMEQAFIKRGDVVKLMSQLEEEYTLVQVEGQKRRYEIRQYRRYAWFALSLVGVIGYRLMTQQDYMGAFYSETSWGKSTLSMTGFLLFISLMALMRISLKNID